MQRSRYFRYIHNSISCKQKNIDDRRVVSPLGWRICSCAQVPDAAKEPQSCVDGVAGKIYLCGLDPPDGIYTTLGGSVLPRMATRWELGHWTQCRVSALSDPRTTPGLICQGLMLSPPALKGMASVFLSTI